MEKNTIIVIWGDNGFHLGEQHLWGKSTNFELDCKVPLLIHPKRINDIVELIDIYPTLTDLCGLKPTHTLSGQSLRFLIENKTNWKNRAFSQFPRPYKAVNSYKNQTWDTLSGLKIGVTRCGTTMRQTILQPGNFIT